VDEVLSMSPDERRSFLDEAADVKRFRTRIKDAHDRLAATRDNIEKVTLIVSEIEPRLAQLSRQAERAAEHQRLSAELRELLRDYYGHLWNEAHNSLIRARAELDQGAAEAGGSAIHVAQLREQLRALNDEIRKRREAISRRDTRSAEIEQRLSSTEHAIALDRERRGMAEARGAEVLLEIEALEAERLALSSSDANEGQRGVDVVAEAEEARASALKARKELDAAEREYSQVRSKVQELRDGAEADQRRAGAMQADTTSAARRINELELELEQADARRKAVLVELIGYGRRYANARASLFEAEGKLDSGRGFADDARDRLSRVQDEVRAYEAAGNQDLRELDHLEGRLDALRRVHAEHDGVA